MNEDSAYTFTPSVNDVDEDDSHSFSITGKPSWAGFDTATGTLSGTPTNDDVGTTSNIVIKVSDSTETVSLAAFNLEVVNVNDAPISVDDVVTTLEDQPVQIDILSNDYDIDQNLVVSSVNLETMPANGTAQFDSGTGKVTYQPEPDFHGSDSFTYKVKDSDLSESELATVIVTVTAVNDVPVAAAFNEKTEEDNPIVLAVRIEATDPEDGTPEGNIEIVGHPKYGVATIVDGANIRYLPNEDYFGQDVLTYRILDGMGLASEAAEIKVLVGAINDRPIALDDTATTLEDETVDITILANDSDIEDGAAVGEYTASQITIINQSSLEKGVASVLSDGKLRYVPNDNSFGTELISYFITDSEGYESLAATVTVTVTPVNDPPVAIDNQAELIEEGTIEINVLGNDYDVDEGDQLDLTSVEIVSVPEGGSITITSTGAIRYRAIENYFGDDLFSYQVKDGNGAVSNIALVNLTVTPVNDIPIVEDDIITKTYSEQNQFELDVLSNDTDVDGDDLTITAAEASVGTVTISDNKLAYQAPAGFIGNVEISYLVSDDNSEWVRATVTLTIEGDIELGTPIITPPNDVELNATALFTKADLGVATAMDTSGKPLGVELVDNQLFFPPGNSIVYWRTVDEQGNAAEASQRVTVHPLISIEKDAVTAESEPSSPASHQVSIYLNGESPTYPVVVPYTVSGTTDSEDHNLVAGDVVIEEGVEGTIMFDVFGDELSEGDETLIITLESITHESITHESSLNLGSKSVYQLLVKEDNISPELTVSVKQASESRLYITNTNELVTLEALVTDANTQDNHQYLWHTAEPLIDNQSTLNSAFIFSPANLAPGHYLINLTVTDDASVPASVTKDIYIEVVSQLASLGSEDSDGDLIPDSEEGFADSDEDGIPDYMDAISECNVLQEQALDSDGYLIEGDPGVCLRKGVTVAANASGGTQLFDDEVEQQLGSDSEATNIGGLFDFIAYGLPTPGQNYQVVFPQRLPIPANAIYRKYSEQKGWFDFTIDSNNYLSSAAGEAGYCPPPGSELWIIGLNEGDWCVQLTIEDGGPNDDDGIVNGSIMDPGGVSVKASENSLPVAESDMVTVGINSSITINALANDSDADGDVINITSVSESFGQTEIINNQLYYTAETDFLGEAVINYGITDSQGGTAATTVTVTVVNSQAPVAVDDDVRVVTRNSIEIDVLANDYDPDNEALQVLSAEAENGTVVVNNDQTISYQSNKAFEGIDTITYQISDSQGLVDVGQVNVDVSNVSSTYVSNSGGGSLGVFGMIGLVIISLYRLVRSYRITTARFIAVLLLLPSSYLQADWFIEADIGQSKARDDLDTTQAQIIDKDDHDFSWALGVGYSVMPDWDFTLRYIDQGEGSATLASGIDASDKHQSLSTITPVLVNGVGLDTRYTFLRYQNIAVAGMVGAMYWESDIDSLYQGDLITNRKDGIDPYLGVEVNYSFTEQWQIGLAVNRYFIDVNDVDTFSLKLKYSFRHRSKDE
ncbi:Ig-like domain-containing protein [Photobacterium minamisatsumaniensis]